MVEVIIRKSKRDDVRTLLGQVDKIRRRVSRLTDLGALPEEVSVRVLNYILSIREELQLCHRSN